MNGRPFPLFPSTCSALFFGGTHRTVARKEQHNTQTRIDRDLSAPCCALPDANAKNACPTVLPSYANCKHKIPANRKKEISQEGFFSSSICHWLVGQDMRDWHGKGGRKERRVWKGQLCLPHSISIQLFWWHGLMMARKHTKSTQKKENKQSAPQQQQMLDLQMCATQQQTNVCPHSVSANAKLCLCAVCQYSLLSPIK